VLKIFQGGEERAILEQMREMFSSARAFKPRASRSESMETYLLGRGFRRSASEAARNGRTEKA
jgi:23S rRNA (uridine2552-2'-O)-methyltransferase